MAAEFTENAWQGNLFAGTGQSLPEEAAEVLVSMPGVRIERIVSHGHSSPEGFWYDQAEEEWVMLVTGRARLEFETGQDPVEMKPGNWVRIPAHSRHRVAWTEPDVETIWLAVFYDAHSGPF